MYLNNKILVGKTKDNKELSILLDKANRHGLITGASGSGKTITLKVMAESFSAAGVSVFLADVKGDLAGTACIGEDSETLQQRIDKLGLTKDFSEKLSAVLKEIYRKIKKRSNLKTFSELLAKAKECLYQGGNLIKKYQVEKKINVNITKKDDNFIKNIFFTINSQFTFGIYMARMVIQYVQL